MKPKKRRGKERQLPQPESMRAEEDLTDIEQRMDLGTSPQEEAGQGMVFNLLASKLQRPREKLMRGFSDAKKIQVYSVYLQSILNGRQVPDTLVTKSLKRLEELLSQGTGSSKHKFEWLPLMKHLFSLSVGTSFTFTMRLLGLLFVKVEPDVIRCIDKGKPVRAGRLAEILRNFLSTCHIKVTSSRLNKSDEGAYSSLVASLMSFFVDLCCLHSSKVNNKKKYGRQVCGFVCYILQQWPEKLLEVALQLSTLAPDNTRFIIPFLSRCMLTRPTSDAHLHYLKYVLVIRSVKDSLDPDQAEDLIQQSRSVTPGVGFLDWMQQHCSEATDHLPLEDRKFRKHKITRFLLDDADEDLILLLNESLCDTETSLKVEKSFLSLYNSMQMDNYDDDMETMVTGNREPARDLEPVARTSGTSDSGADNLFFLDRGEPEPDQGIAGKKDKKAGKGKKVKEPEEVITLKSMEELSSIVDEDTCDVPHTYKLDKDLVTEKFSDPDTKNFFLESEIVSIKTLTADGSDVLSDEDEDGTMEMSLEEVQEVQEVSDESEGDIFEVDRSEEMDKSYKRHDKSAGQLHLSDLMEVEDTGDGMSLSNVDDGMSVSDDVDGMYSRETSPVIPLMSPVKETVKATLYNTTEEVITLSSSDEDHASDSDCSIDSDNDDTSENVLKKSHEDIDTSKRKIYEDKNMHEKGKKNLITDFLSCENADGNEIPSDINSDARPDSTADGNVESDIDSDAKVDGTADGNEKQTESDIDSDAKPDSTADGNEMRVESDINCDAKPDGTADENEIQVESDIDSNAKPDSTADANEILIESDIDSDVKPDDTFSSTFTQTSVFSEMASTVKASNSSTTECTPSPNVERNKSTTNDDSNSRKRKRTRSSSRLEQTDSNINVEGTNCGNGKGRLSPKEMRDILVETKAQSGNIEHSDNDDNEEDVEINNMESEAHCRIQRKNREMDSVPSSHKKCWDDKVVPSDSESEMEGRNIPDIGKHLKSTEDHLQMDDSLEKENINSSTIKRRCSDSTRTISEQSRDCGVAQGNSPDDDNLEKENIDSSTVKRRRSDRIRTRTISERSCDCGVTRGNSPDEKNSKPRKRAKILGKKVSKTSSVVKKLKSSPKKSPTKVPTRKTFDISSTSGQVDAPVDDSSDSDLNASAIIGMTENSNIQKKTAADLEKIYNPPFSSSVTDLSDTDNEQGAFSHRMRRNKKFTAIKGQHGSFSVKKVKRSPKKTPAKVAMEETHQSYATPQQVDATVDDSSDSEVSFPLLKKNKPKPKLESRQTQTDSSCSTVYEPSATLRKQLRLANSLPKGDVTDSSRENIVREVKGRSPRKSLAANTSTIGTPGRDRSPKKSLAANTSTIGTPGTAKSTAGTQIEKEPDVEQLPEPVPRGNFQPVKLAPEQDPTPIMFDLETTDFIRGRQMPHITQIAAMEANSNDTFQVYVEPELPMDFYAQQITGIAMNSSGMTVNGEPVECCKVSVAMEQFATWLAKYSNVILVAHSGKRFDFPIIMSTLANIGTMEKFCQHVSGMVDSWPIFKKSFPGLSSYKQKDLVKNVLNMSYAAHNAVEDVRTLSQLFNHANLSSKELLGFTFSTKAVHCQQLFNNEKAKNIDSLIPLITGGSIKRPTAVNIAGSGLSLSHLKKIVERDGEDGLLNTFTCRNREGKPRVTNAKRTLEKVIPKIVEFFQKN